MLSIFRELLRRGIGMILVHVADGEDVTKTAGVFSVATPHPAATDQSNAWTVIGADAAGRLGCGLLRDGLFALYKPQRQTRGSRSGGTFGEERAAGNLEWLGHGPLIDPKPVTAKKNYFPRWR